MSSPFVPLALAWLAGLWLADVTDLSAAAWLLLLALSVGALAALFLKLGYSRPYTRHSAVMGTLMVVFVAGGASRGALDSAGRDTLAQYNDDGFVTAIGTVERFPEQRDTYVAYTVAADVIRPAGASTGTAVRGLALVRLPAHPAYQYGDRLQLTGRLESPTRFAPFDYRAYLALQNIHSVFEADEVTLMARHQGAPLFQALSELRGAAQRTNQSLLPEPHASLLNGILLGLNSAIPDSVQESFNATGTTHVLVISGANFAVLVAMATYASSAWLGARRGAWVAIGVIVAYALFAGGGPAVLRAAVMGGITAYAVLARRRAEPLNSLAVAVAGLTAISPAQRSDVGFQLSVLATLGIILLVPLFERSAEILLGRARVGPARRERLLRVISDSLLISLAPQVITAPLIAGTFGRFSPVSLLTNLFIGPVQPYIMQSGLVASAVGMMFLPLGRILSVLPFAGVAWTLAAVEWSARLPFASVSTPTMTVPQIWGFYGAAAFALWFSSLPSNTPAASPFDVPSLFGLRRRTVAIWGGLLLIAIIPWWVAKQQPDGRLHLYMLDVGQGDALMIVTPDGRQAVIDGGEEPMLLLRAIGEVLPFWDRSLDLVIATHPDGDHLGGLPELLRRYDVTAVVEPGDAAETSIYQAWQAAIDAEGAQRITASAGQQLELGGGVTARVLAPGAVRYPEPNLNSVVLELRYGRFCALLTGDIAVENEAALAEQGALSPCQVLKVAHHGSTTSTSAAFLERVAPAYALISAGSGNRFGHPAAPVLERLEQRGIRIFRTDQQGTIHLATDGSSVWVDSQR